ncbi:MAG TPA: glycosyltransferase, partial [Vicinamibacterales bacterium]|nr:glycosyltransferase [Vicinamibacterales bacterium]
MAQPASPEATTVLIPAFNEAESIGGVVAALRISASWLEIIVINDGSVDETRARAEAAGARVISHPYNKGNGAAVKTGLREARG